MYVYIPLFIYIYVTSYVRSRGFETQSIPVLSPDRHFIPGEFISLAMPTRFAQL